MAEPPPEKVRQWEAMINIAHQENQHSTREVSGSTAVAAGGRYQHPVSIVPMLRWGTGHASPSMSAAVAFRRSQRKHLETTELHRDDTEPHRKFDHASEM